MNSPAQAEAISRAIVDQPYPDDPIEFFRQHGFSGRKEFFTRAQAATISTRLWGLHDHLQATLPADAPSIVRSMPWPVASIPNDILAELRLTDLTDLARELLDGDEPHALSWQAFARRAGQAATPWHSDDVAVPVAGPCVAFWIPLTEVPTRTGLIALADVDGTGLRPVRQADQDPGDLTWHDMTVVHRAEDCPVDFLAFGIAVAGSRARIDLGSWPHTRALSKSLCRRISPDLRDRGSVVTEATPPLASLGV